MKKDEIPQDNGALNKLTREVVYATDQSGKYSTALSTGWDVKTTALDVAWDDIEHRIAAAKAKVIANKASPLLYFMELRLMDPTILSGYTGFWKWTIKRHLKPSAFKKLSEAQLKKYAEAFNVSVEELKMMTLNEK